MKHTKHPWWTGITAIALVCAAGSFARADQDPVFEQANQEYSDGHFQQAIKSYESLVASGQWSANLFYDLGNAWFRLGDFGQAILNYERALALDPHHPEATANLALVRDEARALELKRKPFERYIEAGTPSQYSIAASIALWFALLLAARLFFSRRRSAALVSLTIFSIILFAAAVFALYSLETGSRGEALAIVTRKEIVARLATADSASSVLALPPGSEIKVLSQRGDWLYAALPNDLRGWIPASGAQRVPRDGQPTHQGECQPQCPQQHCRLVPP
jgi:tetratricopeptide (TPR) repeat protein